jgi:hypothetical protein
MTATSSDTTAAAFDWDTIPEAIRKEMNISQEEFEEVRRNMAEREQRVPAVGTLAPDFELRRLAADGSLSQDLLRLSDLRGKPVALVFGSYT